MSALLVLFAVMAGGAAYPLAIKPSGTTLAAVESLHALRLAGAVRLEWTTRYEEARRARLTPELLPGSALFPEQGAPLQWPPSQPAEGKLGVKRQSLETAPPPSEPWAPTWRAVALLDPPRNTPLDPAGRTPSARGFPLRIRATGWYRVEAKALFAAGFPRDVLPHRLGLTVEGQPSALRILGEEDGKLDEGDVLEFFATRLDTPWTDTRTYWLSEGEAAGSRIPAAEGSPPAVVAEVFDFPHEVEWKESIHYFAPLLNGEADNVFGPVVTAALFERRLPLGELGAAEREATLEVGLQGASQLPHEVEVRWDGVLLGEVRFTGQSLGAASFLLVPGALAKDAATLSLSARGEGDVSLLAHVRIRYSKRFTARQDELAFRLPGESRATLTGFSTPLVRIWDVTDTRAPVEVSASVMPGAEGGYAVEVASGAPAERVFLAVGAPAERSPWQMGLSASAADFPGADRPSEVLVVSHPAFSSALPKLAQRLTRQGWTVQVAFVQDIYDAFGYGAKSPHALKAFFSHAHTTWAFPPRYVLLVGDASFDAKNRLGQGDFDLVPTRLMDTQFLEAASDGWLVDFDEDGLPELALGRLPARTLAQLDVWEKKAASFSALPDSPRQLLVADTGFEALVSGLEPAARFGETDFLLGTQLGPEMAEAVQERLQAGPSLVYYHGHGSISGFAGGLTASTFTAPAGTHPLPVHLHMTCMSGFFHDAYIDSMAETLLWAEGGARAVWASSALTFSPEQLTMSQAFFDNAQASLGEAIAAAKRSVSSADARESWNLLGEPTTFATPDPAYPRAPEELPEVASLSEPVPRGCGCGASPFSSPAWAVALSLLVRLTRRTRTGGGPPSRGRT